jgi:glycine dehydrogenase subunit 1
MSINYLAHTAEERSAMLGAIGMQSMADIFKVIPASLQDFTLQLPEGLSELELTQELQLLSSRNRPLTEQSSFLGAGAYHHFVPAALDLLITRCKPFMSFSRACVP